MDTSDPHIRFDRDGVCNHCRRADRLLPTVHWTPDESERALAQVADRIRKAGAGHEYDSIVGLSGGVDFHITQETFQQPLLIHGFALRREIPSFFPPTIFPETVPFW